MLRLFGQNTPVQAITLLAAMVLIWARPLAHTRPMAEAAGYAPLYTPLCSLAIPPLAAAIAAMLLILLGGYCLNLMLAHTNLVPQNNILPMFLYCIYMSATATTLSPTLLANLLVLPIINLLLLRGSSLTISTDKIFGAAVLISIASMVYLPMLTLLVAYLLVAVNYRLYSWRDWIVLLLGLLAPYLPLWGYHFATGTLDASLAATASGLSNLDVRILSTDTLPAVANMLLVAVAAVSLVALWLRLGDNPVAWQKNAVTVMLAAVSGLAMLFYSRLFPVNLQFFAAPFSLCGTQMFLSVGRRRYRQRRQWQLWTYDILLILILLAAIVC